MGHASAGNPWRCSQKGRKQGEHCHWEAVDDPLVSVTDLLLHLVAKQLEKKASVVIEGEQLDVLIDSRPPKQKDKDEGKKEKETFAADVKFEQ